MSLTLAYAAILAALGSAAISLWADRYPPLLRLGSFLLLGAGALCAVGAGLGAVLGAQVFDASIALGLPWLHWQLHLDPLSGFFFVLIGLVTLAVALYGPAYVREYGHGKQSLAALGVFTGLFVAGMQLVLLAADAFSFLVAWELMSVSSYFLVAFQHQHAANRRAAYLYLLMAHVGALAILLAFAILAGFGGGFAFTALRGADLSLGWASLAFALALFGFGMKAGLVPVHVWLPEAHPVAPSHISALMSGVMLKVAVYGLIRFTYDLLGPTHWAWGVVILIVGVVSALLGVLYALMQHDLKRLLAYHSVENIGIIFIGLGLGLIFAGTGHPVLAALGLVAALYHTLNHALFKGLLFLGAGSILHASHEGDLEHMGGLIRRMPQTAFLFLIGCISISALPPFNGFVSEWLTFQAALQAPALENGILRALIPVTAAGLALTGALAAACFVKVYGIAFLGKPRSRHIAHAREVHWGMRSGMAWLALLCLLLGVLPTWVVQGLDAIPQMLLGAGLTGASAQGWLWLTPISPETASYGAPLVLAGILLAWGIGFVLLHPRGGAREIRHGPPWDCGFGPLSARMQYTSTAFTMPIRRIFQPLWQVDEQVKETLEPGPPSRLVAIRYHLQVSDHAWRAIYDPITHAVVQAARVVSRIQSGNIRTYLAYSFVTLLVLLWLIS